MNARQAKRSGSAAGGVRQTGMMTTFTAVLILLLLTLMVFFALRVGVFDQRISSNDLRQKRAFHAAESAIQHAKEYFLANSVLVASSVTDLLPNGADGWLSTGAERWQPCSGAGLNLSSGSGSHPCFGEPNPDRRSDLYYYSFANSTEVPVDTETLLPGTTEQASVQALLCVLDIDYDAVTPVQGCSTDTTVVDGDHFMITLLGRGESDCDGTTCRAEALVREQVSNFGGTAGGQAPSVPLVTKSTFPPSGTAEIVPNPNSGGVGVPISVWMNANTSCNADGSIIDPSSGSWATCEMHEWYGVDQMPDDYACPGNCSCSQSESISYTHGTSDTLGIDLVQDENFPCDLFKFYFGVPRTNYEIVKGFSQVLSDCSTLGPNSNGIYWISGAECRVNSNTTVGSPDAPVLLISAATETRFNGGAQVYGVVYISDTEKSNATLYSNGNNTIYGQVIVDATLGSYQGTFQVVYNENTIGDATGGGGLGNVIGGWADFHPDWR
ncbi:hypothetical protein [Elongatibacter sediminis]|uniref:Type 4 fimbrial biogenesis protein PilX N-terminal domain-containing protein n=1 Tax=Elongatibacter sediminis TaxID=3119006 RepID=A0AAW9RHR6_9GAMM